MAPKKRGFRTVAVTLPRAGKVTIYASQSLADAFEKIVGDMPVFDGVKVIQMIDAAYRMGTIDGAQRAFTALDKGTAEAKKQVAHRRPGRPRLKPKSN